MKSCLLAVSASLPRSSGHAWRFTLLNVLAGGVLTSFVLAADTQPVLHKTGSAFYPPALLTRAQANVAKYPWAAAMQKEIVQAAQPWMAMSDDALWSLMFGNTIKRSWMVWSSGVCPACKKGVPMYNWRIDALGHPWKVRCPHCKEYFPKNDFAKFYGSGLDEHGIFDPRRADRSLLFNTDHPDASDPLHTFGVDDGEGFSDGQHTWRFIGAYLIYGQWKQAVVGGIKKLAAAYVVTGDPAYAHKTGILLDRVADLYPTFDFIKQGVIYDAPSPAAGYVSVWHDACEETRELVMGYDMVFDAIRNDKALPTFLAKKAEQHKLGTPKATFADIQRNIEDRLLRDPLANRPKITSNYPRTEVAAAIIETVLGGPEAKGRADRIIDAMLTRATAIDGVTGEKGLAGYTCYTIQGVAILLEQYARIDPGFLKDLLKRHPKVHDMYRFHIDTWIFQKYYPLSGDTGSFAAPVGQYVGVAFSKKPDVTASMFSFIGRLYETTGDVGFAQVLYNANDGTVNGLPYDLFAEDPTAIQKSIGDAIACEGPTIKLGSVNKQQWHIGILRSGKGADARAAWLDYDASGNHSHADGMNLGLFAKGLDLLPDFGYPPVNFGGWGSPRAVWYTMTAAHNTVVVDGHNQQRADGKCTLWANGREFRAIRVSGPALIGGKQYERTVATIDGSDRDFYLLDVFRVVGGTDHAKFTHGHFGRVTTNGLSLEPCDDYGNGTQMRSFRCDPKPSPGWSVDWTIDDRRHLLPTGSDVHLRYTDLTTDAQAATCEAWVQVGLYDSMEEAWIPRVLTRRQAKQTPLASTFVSVIEPYDRTSRIAAIRRLPLETEAGETYPDANVAVEVQLADGRRDLVIAMDIENPTGQSPSLKGHEVVVRIPSVPKGKAETIVRTDADLSAVRLGPGGNATRVAVCHGTHLQLGETSLKLKKSTEFVEIEFGKENAVVVAGDPAAVEEITAKGQRVRPQ